MAADAYECFLKAFKVLTEREGWGIQVRLAEELVITPRHINDILKERKRASLELQDRIARFFGMPYEEMLAMGRVMAESESGLPYFPYAEKVAPLPAHSIARAALIYQLAGEEVNLVGLRWFTEQAIEHLHPPGVDDYLAGRIGDRELYEEARKEVGRVETLVREHLEKKKKRGKRRSVLPKE
jgi:predicted transcriptional regulator